MLFSDYVRILQNYFQRSIGEHELCSLLFDSVIVPADLKNDKGEILSISKSAVSKIMNNASKINQQIRDHIYDDEVVGQLTDFFDKQIVPELNPDVDDLCHQILGKIQSDNISERTKADFKMLAKPKTIGSFLAKAFTYAVIYNEPDNISLVSPTNKYESSLLIKSIKNGRLSDEGECVLFSSLIGLSRKSMIDDIKKQYHLINKIHLKRRESQGIVIAGKELKLNFLSDYKVSDEDKEIISLAAEELQIKLSDDFFDCGDLGINPFGGVSSIGMPTSSYAGTAEEKQKAQMIDDLGNMIQEFFRKISVIDALSNKYCLPLVLENSGKQYDEDVRIDIEIDKKYLITAEEIYDLGSDVCDGLLNEIDYESHMYIKKGASFLEYSESENRKAYGRSLPRTTRPPFDLSEPAKEESIEDIQRTLGYSYVKSDKKFIIQLVVDKINQHTAVAFPAYVLLNDVPKKLKYTIRSRKNGDIISGSISINSPF